MSAAEARVDALNERAWALRSSDHAAMLARAREACALAEEAGYARGLAGALRNRGAAHCLRHEHDDALRDLERAAALFDRLRDPVGKAGALNWIGGVHWRRADYAAALDRQLEALRIQRDAGDAAGEADSLNHLGNVYYNLGDYARALESYGASLRLKEALGDALGVSQCVNNLGNIHGRLGEYAQALERHLRALELKREVGDRVGEGIALINVGASHEALGDLGRALEWYGAALEHARALEDRRCESDVLRSLGDVHRRLGDLPRAYEHYAASLETSRAGRVPSVEVEALIGVGETLTALGEGARAVEPLREALARAEEAGTRRLVYEAHRALADAHAAMGYHRAALEHFRAFHAVEDEVFSQESDRRIQAIRVQAEVERSHREAELLREKNAELTEANDALRRADEEKALLLWQLRLQAEELERQTKEDALTGLYNRRHLDAQLALELERARRFGRDLTVVMADLDRFKQVNDRFSHAVGDAVLRAVGRLLREHTRAVDVVGRYGGEEFVLLLVETPPEKAAGVCEKLRALIANHDWAEVHPELRVTISMGLAGLRELETPEQLLAAADARLYQAKRTGRNRVCG
ncbi:MAG TPA: diguanylate cyclase [Longimicrobiaceae bacterium]|nr:diguanylate cyclase [Longimicrobiaceae bacterium]